MEQLKDLQGRNIKYLRISTTDRCNFRCRYCTPASSFEYIPHENMLRYEEILFASEVFAELGVERIRVTGGEPLVRRNIPFFLSKLHQIPGIKEITITTNGTMLEGLAEDIYNAGVRRLNISLDSLIAERYKYVTGGFDSDRTLRGIKKAQEIGFKPIKINSVVVKGFNDDEIIPFCEFAAENDFTVRFIEFMPIGNSNDWKKENILSGHDILEKIKQQYTVTELPKAPDTGPAKNYRLSNGATIGVITPMTDHFCSSCDKLRLTADGKIRPCLLSDKEVSIIDAVRARDKNALTGLIRQALGLKSEEHSISVDSKDKFSRTMSKIGG